MFLMALYECSSQAGLPLLLRTSLENELGQIEICGEYSPDEADLLRSLSSERDERTGPLLPQLNTDVTGVIPLRFFGLESLLGYLTQKGDVVGLCRGASMSTLKDKGLKEPHLYYQNAKDVASCGSSKDHLTVVIDGLAHDLHQWTDSDPMPRPVLQGVEQDHTSILRDAKFEKIWAGEAHMLALATDGTLYSWGSGRYGQLGHGNLVSVSTPKPIESLQGIRIVDAACGASFSVALSETGDIYSFGLNDHGQLGIGKQVSSRSDGDRRNTSYPQLVDFYIDGDQSESIDVNVTRVACGRAHTVVLDDLGQAWSCGWGKYGQLGQGNTSDSIDVKQQQEQIIRMKGTVVRQSDQFHFKKVIGQTGKSWKDIVCGLWNTFMWTL
ncbi:RCC1 domain-containing protein 1 [Mortierella sp. AD011]|nr:RCC1 domain-containing protein 1 [Mortierella sp. AD011]